MIRHGDTDRCVYKFMYINAYIHAYIYMYMYVCKCIYE